MYGRRLRFTFLWCASLCLCLCAVPVYSQILQEETLAGADAHETAENTKGYLFGEWGGVRTRLLERGVKLDLHSISDSLWNIKSQQSERFASYNRVRGAVDIDLGTLVHQQGWSFHATAVWQTGDNLGSCLGLVANPTCEPSVVHDALRAFVAIFRAARGFLRACTAVFLTLGAVLTTDGDSSLGCFAVRWWPWFSGWIRAASASIRS